MFTHLINWYINHKYGNFETLSIQFTEKPGRGNINITSGWQTAVLLTSYSRLRIIKEWIESGLLTRAATWNNDNLYGITYLRTSLPWRRKDIRALQTLLSRLPEDVLWDDFATLYAAYTGQW